MLEKKKNRHASMPNPSNQIAVEDIKAVQEIIARESKQLVYVHYNLIVVCDKSVDMSKPTNHLENDQLVAMAKELTEALRNSKTIDWRRKESARAKMRTMVKRLLKKYNYPPEEQENALDTVIRQCELIADED